MRTTTTHPDGSQTTTVTQQPIGCCGWVALFFLGALVIGGPAAYFPRWAEILAYAVEGTVALLLVVGLIASAPDWYRRTFRRASPPPPGPPSGR